MSPDKTGFRVASFSPGVSTVDQLLAAIRRTSPGFRSDDTLVSVGLSGGTPLHAGGTIQLTPAQASLLRSEGFMVRPADAGDID